MFFLETRQENLGETIVISQIIKGYSRSAYDIALFLFIKLYFSQNNFLGCFMAIFVYKHNFHPFTTRIRLGVCALVWALWNCRNDMVFNKIGTAHFLQVIRMATHWTREWSYLLPEAQRAPMDSGCIRLEMVARAIYNQGGWRLFKRLHDA
jgi:hypothetical protein